MNAILPNRLYETIFHCIEKEPDAQNLSTLQKINDLVLQIFLFIKDLAFWLFSHHPFDGIANRNEFTYQYAIENRHRLTYLLFSWITGKHYEKPVNPHLQNEVEIGDFLEFADITNVDSKEKRVIERDSDHKDGSKPNSLSDKPTKLGAPTSPNSL